MPTSTADLLDLVILNREEKVRFDVLDQTGTTVGTLQPQTGAQITCDATQQIKRKLSGLRITSSEYASINPLRHRLKPYWVLSNAAEYPLGVFLFADATTARYSYGTELTATLTDQGLILGQEIAESIGFPAGTSASTAITTVIQTAGIFNFSVATSPYTFGSPLAWPAGKTGTTYASILDDICTNAGLYSPYFDSGGTLQVRAVANVASTTPSLNYIDGGRIISGSITESNDLLNAPNRFLAVDTAATTGPVTGVYTIPAAAPNSYETRGFYITKVVEAPGAGDVAQAVAVAAAYYQNQPQAYAQASWSSPADPRHETFDVVNYRGVNYLETSWSLRLAPGGPMTHKAQRVYL